MATTIGTITLGNGVNLQPSYYNNGHVNFGWDLMRLQTDIKTVRIEIEPVRVNEAKKWIAEALHNGYTVIATYHKYGIDPHSIDPKDLLDAANWWQANYQTLGGNFIINLMNEWATHTITAAQYAKAYNDAIKIVRTVYPTGPIIIDLPGAGQDTQTARDAVLHSNPRITDANVVLSVHIYPGSWNSGTGQFLTATDLDDMTATGKPCIVGEFGKVNDQNNGCDWEDCVNAARAKGWTVLGWCWNGDGLPEDHNMVSPPWRLNATASTFTKSAYFNVIYPKLAATAGV